MEAQWAPQEGDGGQNPSLSRCQAALLRSDIMQNGFLLSSLKRLSLVFPHFPVILFCPLFSGNPALPFYSLAQSHLFLFFPHSSKLSASAVKTQVQVCGEGGYAGVVPRNCTVDFYFLTYSSVNSVSRSFFFFLDTSLVN